VVKTFAASLVALYIAFRLASTIHEAFLSAFVVSQPDSGLVPAKSSYRILGTLVGTLVLAGCSKPAS
jgi:uncharacterized membrane protein YccC